MSDERLRRKGARIDPPKFQFDNMDAEIDHIDRLCEVTKGRAEAVVKELLGLIRAIDQQVYGKGWPNLDDAEHTFARVNEYWELLKGRKPHSVARMLLLDLIQTAEQACSTFAQRRPSSPTLEPATYVVELFRGSFPEFGAQLTAADVQGVIDAWNRRGRPRESRNEPTKWEAVLDLRRPIGLGDINEASLAAEWSRWKGADARKP